jgi:hypothetical protein
MSENNKQIKKQCCQVHPMYDTLTCENQEEHEGLHRAFYYGEYLRWGVPTYKEMYDVKKDKQR